MPGSSRRPPPEVLDEKDVVEDVDTPIPVAVGGIARLPLSEVLHEDHVIEDIHTAIAVDIAR